jgi:hypothetical protein
LTKAGKVTAPYPKVAKKRRASIVACSDVVKKVKLSDESIPVVAKRSLPIPADVNTGANDVGEVASVDDLLAGCDTTIDECVLNEMFIGEDSLDSLISTDSDVADYFSAGDAPASDGDDDANREQNDVAGVIIKKEVIDDEVQFVRNVSTWENKTEDRLWASEAKVGDLQSEVSKGRQNLAVSKAGENHLIAKCEQLKRDRSMLKKVAKKIEIRMNASDKKYADLVASMEKYENHPVLRVKKAAGLAIAKTECKDVSCEFSAMKSAICEKNCALRKLEASNKRWDAAQKVKDN